MKLNRTGSNWDRLERNKINENWDIIEGNHNKLEGEFNDVVGKITDEVVGHLIDSARLDWKEPVDTVEDLPASAEVGETRMVREADPDGISYVYRYDGEEWEKIQEIDVTLVNEVDSRLTRQLAETESNINGRSVNVMYPPPPFIGAEGDGTTDDWAAIQGIIDVMKETGTVIFIPEGIFRTSKPVVVPGGVSLLGAYKSNFGAAKGTVIKPLPTFVGNAILQVGDHTDDVSERMSIGVANIKLDGSAATDIEHGLLTNKGSSNISLFNIESSFCVSGFTFDYCWNIDASLLTTHKCISGFRYINGGGTSSSFRSCIAYNCHEIGFNIEDTDLHYSSFQNCGVDGADIAYKITAPLKNCSFYNCGAEKHRILLYADHPEAFLNFFGLTHATSVNDAKVFVVENIKQLNLFGVNLETNWKIFEINKNNVKRGAVRLSNCNIRTLDGRSMGDSDWVIDSNANSTYGNPINMTLFENRAIKKIKTVMRVNRRMKVVLPVKEPGFWSSIRIITQGFSNPQSDETGGLITLSAINNNGTILYKTTNSNENNYVEASVVGNTVEFIIKASHDRSENFVIHEIEGYSYRDDIEVYAQGQY